MNRILIVENEPEMAELLVQALTEQGYACEVASDGARGLKMAPGFDLLLVDVMMPVMNGFTMVRRLRDQGTRMPVLFLTAKDSTKDVVEGLESGGDDYLVKPFKLDELLARIKAALRRARDTSQLLKLHDLTLDCGKRIAFRGEFELFFSPTEFALMELFLRRAGTVLSKAFLLEEVWHDSGFRDENIVETYVTYVRRKSEVHGAPRLIHTVKGRGYVLALVEPKS